MYLLEPQRVPTIYVLSKNKKNINFFLMKFSIFTGEKNLCILHGEVFVVNSNLVYTIILGVCFSTVLAAYIQIRARGYKTFFKLSSAEHEISTAHKY